VVVSGRGVGPERVQPIAHEVNDRVRLEASVRHAHLRVGEPIELRVRLRAPMPLPGASVTAHVRTPEGDVHGLDVREHTGAGDDPHEAGTYTAIFDATRTPGAYTIQIGAARGGGRVRSALDEYYAGRPGLAPDRLVHTVTVPEIRRRAVLAAVVDLEGRTERDPIAGYNPRLRSDAGIDAATTGR
jgi:hypothetical protein